jgi:hypothetical protein
LIDLKTFKQELMETVSAAEEKDRSGPDIHAQILEILLADIKEYWDVPEDSLGEILYVLNKIYPKANL